MFREEYEKLLGMLENLNSSDFNLEALLKESVAFFEILRKEFPSAPKEKRDEMIQMMTTLHSKLQEVSKITAKSTGMTEEELSAFADNPSNFTPEQWQSVQDSRRELYDSARKFSSELHAERRRGKSSEGEKKIPPPVRPRTARATRKDWKKT